MSEKHFSIFRHKNVSEVPHKSQYIRFFGKYSICKSTLPASSGRVLFFTSFIRSFVFRSGSEENLNLSSWIRGCGGYGGTG